MEKGPRVAFFADSYHEVNGVALTCRALDRFAARRSLPFLCIRGAPAMRTVAAGMHQSIDLRRGWGSFALDPDLEYDLLWPRHLPRMEKIFRAFKPEVVHITGPNDMGQLGALMAYRHGIPVVASWHTNVHEFAARRVAKLLSAVPATARQKCSAWIEHQVLRAVLRFYRTARLLLAPNPELVAELGARTGKPVFLMKRGVDTDLFSPARRTRGSPEPFRLGYVGRISSEKNVRLLATLEQALLNDGLPRFEFVIVGKGGERAWLAQHMRTARFPGVLRDDRLAREYADMDLLVFPSQTDTFGNVALEALASGTPVVVTNRGGPQWLIENEVTGFIAADEAGFIQAAVRLMKDPAEHTRMRLAARDRALRASWDAVFGRVYEIYELARSDRAPGPPAVGDPGRPAGMQR